MKIRIEIFATCVAMFTVALTDLAQAQNGNASKTPTNPGYLNNLTRNGDSLFQQYQQSQYSSALETYNKSQQILGPPPHPSAPAHPRILTPSIHFLPPVH
jgi:hypothetical protein